MKAFPIGHPNDGQPANNGQTGDAADVMKRIRYVERTGSFLFNLIVTGFVVVGAYGVMTGGRYHFVNQNALALVEWLIVIWPVIAMSLLLNRNWLRKAR